MEKFTLSFYNALDLTIKDVETTILNKICQRIKKNFRLKIIPRVFELGQIDLIQRAALAFIREFEQAQPAVDEVDLVFLVLPFVHLQVLMVD